MKQSDRIDALQRKVDQLETVMTQLVHTINYQNQLLASERKSSNEIQTMMLSNIGQIARYVDMPLAPIPLPKPN